MSEQNSIQPYLTDVLENRVDLELVLRDEQGAVVGQMRPLTRADASNEEIVAALTEWRNANAEFFFGQFHATNTRTRAWLENVVLVTPGQMLWLIYAEDQLIGHFGFKSLTATDVLLDNAMRGVRAGHPKLLQYAGRALINWLFEAAGVQSVYGYVLTTNVPALILNKQLGFQILDKYPMLKTSAGDEVNWVMGEKGGLSEDGVYCYKIQIDKSMA